MIIGGKRKCGKTTRAILESNESRAVIVTATREMAKCIEMQAKKMGLNIQRPLGYEEFIQQQNNGLMFEEVIIDEVELVLRKALNVKNIVLSTASTMIEELDELCCDLEVSKEETLFEKSKRLYNDNKDKLTEEENKVIEYLDSEILEYSEIGYDGIERKFEFSEHGLLRAKRIAAHYDEQGFSVELNDLSNLLYPNRFEISIGWRE